MLKTEHVPGNLKAMIEQWYVRGVDGKGLVVWRLMLPAIWWSIWLKRKYRGFENISELAFMAFRRTKEKYLFSAVHCIEFNSWSIMDVKVGSVSLVKGRM